MNDKAPVMDTATAPLEGGWARLTYVLLAVYLVGLHLRLTVYTSSGSTLVPMYLMLLSAGFLAVAQADMLIRRLGRLLFVLVLFIVVQPFITWAPLSGGSDTLLSGLQLFAAMVAALAVIHTASRLEAQGLRKLFFGFWAVLMLLAVLENAGLRTLMQSVQVALYAGSNRGVYSAELRDIELYGQVRASALASEPSFLADSWLSMAVLVFLLDRNRGSGPSWVRLVLMLGIGYSLAPSMKIFFYVLALLVWHFWPRTSRAVAGVLAGLVLAGWLLYVLSAEISSVMSRIGSVETGSFFARITVGPHIGAEALRNYPFLGYGFGNHEGLTPLMRDVWQATGGFSRFPWFSPAAGQGLLTNGFWWEWVYLGVLGGIVFTYLIMRLLASLDVEHPGRVVVCSWIVWYSGYAFVDPVSWWVVAMFAIPEVVRRASTDLSPTAGERSRRGQPPRDRRGALRKLAVDAPPLPHR